MTVWWVYSPTSCFRHCQSLRKREDHELNSTAAVSCASYIGLKQGNMIQSHYAWSTSTDMITNSSVVPPDSSHRYAFRPVLVNESLPDIPAD